MFGSGILQFVLGAMSLIALALYATTWRGNKTSSRVTSAVMALLLASAAYIATEVYALPALHEFEAGDVVRKSAMRLAGAMVCCVAAWMLAIRFAQQSVKVRD